MLSNKKRGATHLHMIPTSRITATSHHSRRSAEAEVDKGVPGLAGPVSTRVPSSETKALGAGVYVCVAFKAVLLPPPMITCISNHHMCPQSAMSDNGGELRIQSTQVALSGEQLMVLICMSGQHSAVCHCHRALTSHMDASSLAQ